MIWDGMNLKWNNIGFSCHCIYWADVFLGEFWRWEEMVSLVFLYFFPFPRALEFERAGQDQEKLNIAMANHARSLW